MKTLARQLFENDVQNEIDRLQDQFVSSSLMPALHRHGANLMTRKANTERFTLAAVSKIYAGTVALHPTDLTIDEGEYLVILGPSGSGKTTLLMALAGFVQPSTGEVLRSGRAITHLPPEKRGFGVVFQGYALFPHLSVADNVAFPLVVRGSDKAEIQDRVKRTLSLMQLTAFADRLPKQLSGGQQQRVALARALVFDPPLLLLDEPMSALDKKLKDELQAELKEIHQRVGTTFVHITHDQDEAMSLADRIVVMDEGRIAQIGPPKELYSRPASRFVADFLGKSNFISGAAVSSRDGRITFKAAQESQISVVSAAVIQSGQAITIAVRPEAVSIGRSANVQGNSNALRGTVRSSLFFGKYSEIRIDVPGVGLMIAHEAANDTAWNAGDEVWARWPVDKGVVVGA